MTTSTGLTGLVVGSVGRGFVGRDGCSRFLPNSQYSLEIGTWAGWQLGTVCACVGTRFTALI